MEAVLVLQKNIGMVRSVDLARHMGFSKPSISHAVFTVTVGRSTSPQRSMTFCACLRQTGGRCLHTTRYTGRSGERMPTGMRATPSDAISAICGKSCTRQSRMRFLPSGASGKLGIVLRSVLNKGLCGGLGFQAVLFCAFSA